MAIQSKQTLIKTTEIGDLCKMSPNTSKENRTSILELIAIP